MLHSLTASDARFKALAFREGLNIIVASRASAQAQPGTRVRDRQRSRNGAGKTSFVHLLHFLLGGDPGGPLRSEALSTWSFTLELDVGSEKTERHTRSLQQK